ncbi:hypothetical protein TI39_contig368g00001 [Zymoseptoria brevis]|uniref:F-box domain-containing protein n=1 Tax=Zymoseptoria brevis TaxID=1047168 RepID=A0A0F4GSN3_9PEZI|nr:hypothetical protein TI39_contig368g00001 [Zymoseptoria brevis]
MDELPKLFAALALEEGRASPPQEHSALIRLPVELKSAILSRLSAAQIERCRLVCHHLKALVDETSSHGTLLGPGPDAFVNALVEFYNHRGLHRECPSGRRFTEAIAVVSSWETEIAGGIRMKQPLSNEDRENRPTYLNHARVIIDVRILHHAPQMFDRQNHGVLDFPSFLSQLSRCPVQGVQVSTDSACWALYTQLDHPIENYREVMKRKHLPFTTAGEVARVFDISSFEAEGFAFCVKTKWAHGRLWELLKGMKTFGPVEKLAILEDLFFF